MSEEVKKENVVKLNIVKSDFVGNVTSKLITSSKLSRMIAKVFGAITPCINGVKIGIQPNGQLSTSVAFRFVEERDILDGKVAFVKSMSKEKAALSIVESINGRADSMRNYDLTDEAKSVLQRLIPTHLDNNVSVFRNVRKDGKEVYEPIWNLVSSDSTYEVDPFRGIFNGVVYVTLDLRRMLTLIFGKDNDEGDHFVYDAMAIRPLQGNQMMASWLIQISQFNASEIKAIAEETNIIVGNNNGYINY